MTIQTENGHSDHQHEKKEATNEPQKKKSIEILPSSKMKLSKKEKTKPAAVKPYALSLCREYLGGVWKQIEMDDFKIKRMTGGLSNYLYICELDDSRFKAVSSEPTIIFLRLYGEFSKNPTSLIKDLLITATMSHHSIGPKLYGVFADGRLEEFIPASCLEVKAMYEPDVSAEIASIMAEFHVLIMPFEKEPSWLWETIEMYIEASHNVTFQSDEDMDRIEKLKKMKLEDEYAQLRKVLEDADSPVVFCHNDVQVGNILKLENKLMYIDYEYGSYNYRGFDFGNHFCEWMFNNTYDDYPFFQYDHSKFPSHEQQLHFVRAYIKSARKGYAKRAELETDSNNNEKFLTDYLDEEKIVVEANKFALASHLLWAFWAIGQAANSETNFDYLEYALARTDGYFKQKKALFPSGF